ncbi:MAG: hypothetical protein KDB00_20455 [Planctomycetales bacterium]|nr:hypothetical protein [Planctomycetales bacterium]
MLTRCFTRFLVVTLMPAAACFFFVPQLEAQEKRIEQSKPAEIPDGATREPMLGNDGSTVYRDGNTLWIDLDQDSIQAGRATIPRLCAPIRSLRWHGESDTELKFVPEIDHWVFSWKQSPKASRLIEVVFDGDPVLPEHCPSASPAGDGSVMMFAHQASTFGEKLRFEPQWYKNTVGYWTVATDYATWELTIDTPGAYSVAVLQGCGEGQGGSDAVMTLTQGDTKAAELVFQINETGHFQNFRWNDLGNIVIENVGKYTLRVGAKRIAKGALGDIRMIHLVKQADRPKG